MHSPPLAGVAAGSLAGHAASRGARIGGRDGRAGRHRVGGDGVDLVGGARETLAQPHAGAVEAENHRTHRPIQRGAGSGERQANRDAAVISRLSLSASRIPLPVWGGIILFVVYLLTLAPSVTFWDAGEFIAAAHSLGIPHPPGTPLFVLLLNVWAKLLFVLPYAMRTNLFSAVVTACAGGVTARLVQRATGNGSMALASGLAAGSMSSVWLNATETEVYAASLALGVAMIWAGERAGRERDQRDRKSTRLNSSHVAISYAVLCLKKK